MDENLHDSRLEIETAHWQAKEARLRKLFGSSPSVENSILREKLRWHENILVKYKNTSYLEERSMLYLIRNERLNLIKQLYPGRLSQILYRIATSAVLNKLRNRMQTGAEVKNKKAVMDQLFSAGFKDAAVKTERYMALGHAAFTVPLSYYVNEKERMDFSLHFKKEESGRYQFEGFKAGLHDLSKTAQNRNHYFSADEPGIFSSKKAYEMLSGRAVMAAGFWKQFDFNDKDAAGSYRIKQFPEAYGYDIEKALTVLPLTADSRTQIFRVINALKDGSRESVSVEKDGVVQKLVIEADPQHKFLNMYDQGLKKITLTGLLKDKKNLPQSVPKQHPVVQPVQRFYQKRGERKRRGRRIK